VEYAGRALAVLLERREEGRFEALAHALEDAEVQLEVVLLPVEDPTEAAGTARTRCRWRLRDEVSGG
jgi:hypothetical protein